MKVKTENFKWCSKFINSYKRFSFRHAVAYLQLYYSWSCRFNLGFGQILTYIFISNVYSMFSSGNTEMFKNTITARYINRYMKLKQQSKQQRYIRWEYKLHYVENHCHIFFLVTFIRANLNLTSNLWEHSIICQAVA